MPQHSPDGQWALFIPIRDACDYSQWLFPVRLLAGARRYALSLSILPGLLLSCGAAGSRCWQSAGVAQSSR